MQEDEVEKIAREKIGLTPSRTNLTLAYHAVLLRVFENNGLRSLGETERALVIKGIQTKVITGLFLDVINGRTKWSSQVKIGLKDLHELPALYEMFGVALEYLSANYESLPMSFRSQMPKGQLDEQIASIPDKVTYYREELGRTATVPVNTNHLEAINTGMNWMFSLILGEEANHRAMSEFAQAKETLNHFYKVATMATSREAAH